MDLSGKHILITQNSLNILSGSEMATKELATYFMSQQAKVTIYTCFLGEKLATVFSELIESGLTIVCDTETRLDVSDFDIVWVHHQLVPPSLLKSLMPGTRIPLFIYSHMSSYMYLELPYLLDFERSVASKILYNSKENYDLQLAEFPSLSSLAAIYPNPAPEEYVNYLGDIRNSGELRRLLVVSNHPPQELIDCAEILKDSGVICDFIGVTTKQVLVTPDLLASYDVVVSIGKTVQYSLVMGLPVYCYDRFGGPGYLSAENFEMAAEFNFSGRGFKQMTAEQIAKDLLKNIVRARAYSRAKMDYAKRAYGIAACIKEVLTATKKRARQAISPEDITALIAAQSLLFELINERHNRLNEVVKLSQESSEAAALKEELSSVRKQLGATTQELRGLSSRRSVRAATKLSDISRRVARPLRKR